MNEIQVKSVLNRKKKRDDWFLDDYTLNAYEGCSFNCQYCYIRGSKYGENMAERLSVKINGLEVLDRQLAFRVKKDQRGIIALSSATDPYLGAEEKLRMTEGYLKLILKHRFPVLIITKSALVLRDLSLLKQINQEAIHAADLKEALAGSGAIISFSLSTIDETIAATLEPGAPSPKQRLETMKKCKEAGFLVGVNCIPSLPYISDDEGSLDALVSAAKSNGADYILVGGLTLFGKGPADSQTLYYKFLERAYPSFLQRYKKLYGSFFMPPKNYLRKLDERADVICKKHTIRRTILKKS